MSKFPPALAQRLSPEPGDEPHNIHGGGIEQLLEVRARQTEIPTPAQIEAPDLLGEATFDTCLQRVLGFEFRRLLPLPCGLEHLMVGLWADRQLAGSRLG